MTAPAKVPIYSTPDVPIASATEQVAVQGFKVEFLPAKIRVGQIRRTTAAHLRLWQVSGALVEDILLVVSELVTNGVLHGHGKVVLRVLCSRRELRVEVTDGNPMPAELRSAGVEDESGRGLFLVSVLAQTWGVTSTTTWCTFRLSARRS